MLSISAKTKLLGILAHPIKHSISPQLHNTALQKLGLDYVYLAFDVPEVDNKDAFIGLQKAGVHGLNISMPYKQIIIPYLNTITNRAKLSGSVNTVYIQDGKYCGDTTDGQGFMQGLYDKGWHPQGKKMTILGAGGAAFAIVVQALLDGVQEVVLYQRQSPRYLQAQEKIEAIQGFLPGKVYLRPLADHARLQKDINESYILVNASSVGMGSTMESSSLPKKNYLTASLKVVDIIYHPVRTTLLKQAEKIGADYMNGKRMLLFQAAASFHIWTKQEMPIDIMKEILEIE